MKKVEVVMATHNLHKLREIKEMLKVFPWIDLVSLRSFPNYTLPAETGVTFEENALLKARDAAKVLNRFVLADDSGLVVPALNGAPGIHSARYAGADATDLENVQKLLKEMECLEDIDRTAYFACVLVLCGPSSFEKIAIGTSEGSIAKKPRGNHGFGYDPVFLKHDYDKTYAELDEATKNRISHRRKAFEKISLHIVSLKSF
jgi:XTP/dITP diphosphohydrolase